MSSSAHRPNRLVFANTETGERVTVRFGSWQHHELMKQRHPQAWSKPLWVQIHTPQTKESDGTASSQTKEKSSGR